MLKEIEYPKANIKSRCFHQWKDDTCVVDGTVHSVEGAAEVRQVTQVLAGVLHLGNGMPLWSSILRFADQLLHMSIICY